MMLEEFCKILNLTEEELLGRSRVADVAIARHIYFWLMCRHGWSTYRVGKSFGGRSHATVINSVKRVDAAIEVNDKKVMDVLAKVIHLAPNGTLRGKIEQDRLIAAAPVMLHALKEALCAISVEDAEIFDTVQKAIKLATGR